MVGQLREFLRKKGVRLIAIKGLSIGRVKTKISIFVYLFPVISAKTSVPVLKRPDTFSK